MRTFRALVVDDDAAIRRIARRTAAATPGLEVRTAATIEEADALIAAEFFNVAFVDLQLTDGPIQTSEGLTILRLLDEVRPSCRALLLTKFFDVYRREIYSMLTPTKPLIDGAVDKTDARVRFATIAKRDSAQWLKSPVTVGGLDTLYDCLPVRSIGTPRTLLGTNVEITRDELDYVVSTLFGQALSRSGQDASDLEIESIALSQLTGGKSKSVVATGRPVNGSGQQGINCVVKIGPRDDTLEELHRYDRYVRFRLSLHRRVELLGHAVGDTIGAVCYSFAGKSPDDITALQTLFDEQDVRALSVIEHLRDDADWQPDGERADDLAAFFDHEYGFDAVRIAKGISAFADRHAATFGGRRAGDEIRFDGGKVSLPTAEDICEGHVLGDYALGTVHGDLNASNVIVSNDDDITLIDFRHTTRGPVTLDLAALHASIRISPGVCEQVGRDAVSDHGIELRLWRHGFDSDGGWWPEQAVGPPPYWAEVAATLMAMARTLPDVSRAEHAATMLLYALRVVRVTALSPAARMRLLVWISALKEVLSAIPEEAPV